MKVQWQVNLAMAGYRVEAKLLNRFAQHVLIDIRSRPACATDTRAPNRLDRLDLELCLNFLPCIAHLRRHERPKPSVHQTGSRSLGQHMHNFSMLCLNESQTWLGRQWSLA